MQKTCSLQLALGYSTLCKLQAIKLVIGLALVKKLLTICTSSDKVKICILIDLDETNTFLIACHQRKRREKKLQSFKVAKLRKCIEFRRNVVESCFHCVSLWEITKSFMPMLLRMSRRSQRYHSRHSAM